MRAGPRRFPRAWQPRGPRIHASARDLFCEESAGRARGSDDAGAGEAEELGELGGAALVGAGLAHDADGDRLAADADGDDGADDVLADVDGVEVARGPEGGRGG